MPVDYVYKKYAWYPKKTTSGKRIWLTDYVLLVKTYYGPSGERPVHEEFVYTNNEWLLEEIKLAKSVHVKPLNKRNRVAYMVYHHDLSIK